VVFALRRFPEVTPVVMVVAVPWPSGVGAVVVLRTLDVEGVLVVRAVLEALVLGLFGVFLLVLRFFLSAEGFPGFAYVVLSAVVLLAPVLRLVLAPFFDLFLL
jgi:hypothetical protein